MGRCFLSTQGAIFSDLSECLVVVVWLDLWSHYCHLVSLLSVPLCSGGLFEKESQIVS